MPEFLVSATNDSGKRFTTRVTAPSAHEAAAKLRADGWDEVTLHTDDMSAEIVSHDAIAEGKITAEEVIRLRGKSGFGQFVQLVMLLYRRILGPAVVGAAVILLYFTVGGPIVLPILAGAVLVFPIGIALWSMAVSKSRKFRRAMEAYSWGRWSEAIELFDAMRPTGKPKVDSQIAVFKAAALAGLGRLDDGLALIEERVKSIGVAEWVNHTRLGQVYAAAKQHDRATECFEKALACDPDNPTLQLEVARAWLETPRNLERARQLINEAEQKHLSDVLQTLLPAVKGLLALNEGKYRQAAALLEEYQSRGKRLANVPLMRRSLDLHRAYLAIAYAHLQEKGQAEKHWRIALPRLQALQASRILDRYAAVNAPR